MFVTVYCQADEQRSGGVKLYNILLNIGLGAVGSIVATVVLYLCSHLYRIGYKEDFEFNLENAYIAVYQIENHHSFPNDYLLVMEQVDNLYRCAFSMYRTLSPLSLWRNRASKKLIITLLHDIIRVCERSKYITIGYEGEREQEARLKKIHKCFYKLPKFDEENISTVGLQLEMIRFLIKGKSIGNTFDEISRLYGENWMGNLLDNGFIETNSFRVKNSIGIKRKCFAYNELEKELKRQHYSNQES